MNNNLDSFIDAYSSEFPYSLDNNLMLNWYTDRIIEMKSGNSLLELGIGHGYSSLKFSKAFNRHLILEGSPEIINQFKDKVENTQVEIVCTYFEDFTTNEKFDVIVMGFILEHVNDPSLVLSKYKNFLEPGGKIYVAVPNGEALNKRIGYEAGMLSDLSQLSPADHALGHKRLFTVETLNKLVEVSGYKTTRVEGIFLKPITTQQIIDLKLSDAILRAMLKLGIQYPELSVAILMELEVES